MSDVITLTNFIDGESVKPRSGKYIDSFNPATGKVFAKVPDSNEEDVNAAVEAAKKAFESWSETSIQYRSNLMLKIADKLESRLEEFAKMESKDQGKTVARARVLEIPRCVANIRFFATSILHTTDESSNQKLPCDAVNYVHRSPVGVAGIISPWNLPLYLLTWKISPAIAFGNTCVCKPSEFTSVTASMLCDVMSDAGLPPGVVNMVFGYGGTVGEAIVQHPDVPLISFTGSTTIGQRIQVVSAPYTKKLSLELGGKNAAVIFDDVDLETCVNTTIHSSFGNQGEICLCTSRIFVQRGIYESFLEKFVAKMKELVVGDPESADTYIGPLVSKQHWMKVKGYIDLANETKGVKVHSRGESSKLNLSEMHKDGYFVVPVALTGMDDDSAFMQEEIFGPVTCITPFDTEEEVIKRANNVPYGLSGCLWTKDVSRVHRVAKKFNAGTIWVNCWLVRELRMPFGGVKLSGVGREGQHDSYHFFTEQINICIKY